MTPGYVFGYGSLVNARTHSFAPLIAARLLGWERAWAHRIPSQGITSLTIVPQPGKGVTGVLAPVPPDLWPELDKREAGYDRVEVPLDNLVTGAAISGVVVTYVSRSGETANTSYPILGSYARTVLQGFGDVYGADAISGFAASTRGSGAPVLDDRTNPMYPRATLLSESEAMLIDRALDGVDKSRA